MSHNFTKVEIIKYIRDVKGLSLKEAVDAYNNGTYTAADVSLWLKTRDHIVEHFYPVIKEQRAFEISAMVGGKIEYAYAIATLIHEAYTDTPLELTNIYDSNKSVNRRGQGRGTAKERLANNTSQTTTSTSNSHSPFDDL